MNDDKFKKRVHVVAGIIWNFERNRILISQRPEHLHKGGYWEFPGGKVEVGESEPDALSRELFEELNIRFLCCEKMKDIDFDYPEKNVKLAFFHVFELQGVIVGNQGQEWRWVFLSDLKNYRFPEANTPIVEELVKKI